MKKIFNILLTAVVALSAFVACTTDYPAGPMASNLTASPATKDVAAQGTTFTAEVQADGFWTAYAPEWITIEPASGSGNQTVTITVAPNDGKERTGKVSFDSALGAVNNLTKDLEATPKAEITVNQEAAEGQGGGNTEGTPISIKDYIALGENSDTYIISGAITRIVNTTYGNFDLTDETGTIYVYGLLNEKGEGQKCFKEKELAMGDVLTVKASSLQDYKGTWEIVDAVYVSHSKSLIELESDSADIAKEGQDFDIKAVVKGADVKADYVADWITFKGADKDGENVTLHFTAAENSGVPRNDVIKISTTTSKGETSNVEFIVNQDGSIPTVTIADVLAAADDNNSFYRVTGFISGVTDLTKGRVNITDATGTVYAYNTRVAKEADASTNLTTLGIGEGDVITIIGYKTTYTNASGSTIELVGYVEDFYKVEKVTVAEFLAKEESADKWYMLEGAVTQPNADETAAGDKFDLATYGNFVLEDETGRAYVYGVKTGLGGESKKFSTLEVNETDIITIVGNRAAYKGNPQVGNAWYAGHKPAAAAAITDATIATVNAAADDPNVLYRVSGYVSNVNNLSKGRIDLTDATGTIYAYNLKVAKDDASTDLAAAGVAMGDIVTAVGYKTTYTNASGSTIELMGYMESFAKVEEVTVEQFLAKDVSSDKWYRLTGTVTKPNSDETAAGNKFDLATYGNFILADETGRTYVYGVLTGYKGENKKFSTLGVKEGDGITIVGNRAAFKEAPQVGNAWYVSHIAITGDDPGEPQPPVVTTGKFVKVTAAPEDWSGKYLLVCDKDDINMAFSGFSGTIGSGAAVTIANGVIANDATVTVYQIEIAKATVTSGAYTIKYDGKFFAWNSGNALNNADEESAKANWNITFETDHTVIRNADTAVRNLQWNKSSPRFACYGNDNQTIIQLYKYSAE